MLLNRYANIDFVYQMHWLDGIGLINKAIDKRNENRDWDIWVRLYLKMTDKTFVSFEDFRKQKSSKNGALNSVKTTEEIIEQAEEIRKLHQGKHEGVRKE